MDSNADHQADSTAMLLGSLGESLPKKYALTDEIASTAKAQAERYGSCSRMYEPGVRSSAPTSGVCNGTVARTTPKTTRPAMTDTTLQM